MSWRVGRKLGRTLYDGDVFVGLMDTPELAAQTVAAVNGPAGDCAALLVEVTKERDELEAALEIARDAIASLVASENALTAQVQKLEAALEGWRLAGAGCPPASR